MLGWREGGKLELYMEYLREALVFGWNWALRESSIFVFREISTSADKFFISGESWVLGKDAAVSRIHEVGEISGTED